MWRDVQLKRVFVFALGFVLLLSALVGVLVGPVRAAGSISIIAVQDAGLDVDGDGRYDVIQFNVTVDVAATGAVYILALINGTQPGQNSSSVSLGRQVVQVWFWGWELYNAGVDGPYDVNLQIRDYPSYVTLNETWIVSTAYGHTQFDPPGALVTSLGTDWPVDTNGNGRYDEVRFNYTLAVIDPNTYSIGGSLRAGSPAQVSQTLALDPGTVSGTFIFPGGLINASLANGPYQFELTAVTPIHYSGANPTSSLSVTMRPYTRDEFDPPYVRLGSPITDEGKDLDGDGLFDEIDVHIPLHLDQPATVGLSGSVRDLNLNLFDNVAAHLLPSGDVLLNLTFPTYALQSQGLAGPYRIDLDFQVVELGGWGQRTTHTTAAYDYTGFSPPSASLAAPPIPATEDVDGDSLFDGLLVNMTLNVLRSGDYFVDCQLVAGSQSVEDARYRHFTLGTTNESVRFSGVAVNRLGQDGPWLAHCWITRLDGLRGDQVTGSVTTPAYVRSEFEFRDPVALTGTVRSPTSGMGIPYTILVVWNLDTDFWTWTQTDPGGHYSLSLYNASWIFLAGSPTFANQPVAEPVSVSGPSTRDLTLGPMPTSRFEWSTNFTKWNESTVNHLRTYAAFNQTMRFNADYLGDRNGLADASELGRWSTYPAGLPYPNPQRYSSTSLFTLAVDNRTMTSTSDLVTDVAGAGSVFLDQPVRVSSRSLLAVAGAPIAGSRHDVKVTIPYDQPGVDTSSAVTLPPGIAASTASATLNVSVSQAGLRSWQIDPLGIPSSGARFATAWINATTASDSDAPVARIGIPSTVERGVPVTFDGSGSTDNVGVTNYSWAISLNGAMRLGYGATFTVAFTDIGTYVVRLTVRDAAGNSNSIEAVVVVQDTHTPPAHEGLVGLGVFAGIAVGGGAAVAAAAIWRLRRSRPKPPPET